jgi:hypothetical protein
MSNVQQGATRVRLRDGGTVYTDTPHKELARVVESARRRGDEYLKVNDSRVVALADITRIDPPKEATA